MRNKIFKKKKNYCLLIRLKHIFLKSQKYKEEYKIIKIVRIIRIIWMFLSKYKN
jgi:hypothetical protein